MPQSDADHSCPTRTKGRQPCSNASKKAHGRAAVVVAAVGGSEVRRATMHALGNGCTGRTRPVVGAQGPV